MDRLNLNKLTAIHLTKHGVDCRVAIEIAGKWYEVIHDNGETISHIVERAGIESKVHIAKRANNGPATRT